MNINTEGINNNVQSKEFKLPLIWRDIAKMKVLLSSFHSRHLDPENYDNKMSFWSHLIKQYCNYSGKANFSLKELQSKFMHGDQVPACLETVISVMEQQKQIRLRSEFEYDPMNTWSGWLINSFVKRPFWRIWLKLKHTIIGKDTVAQALIEWVHIDALQSICDNMEKRVLQKNRGKLVHFEAFGSLCNTCEMHIHAAFLPLCLETLQARRRIALEHKIERNTRRIHLIKIPAKENEILIISEADHAIHNLEMTRSSLLKQLESLETDIRNNDEKLREYVKENKRQLAKTYLRKRLLLEKNHERRGIALFNIETLLSNVTDAHSNGVVLDAYKIGSKALQKVLNESGLKYDSVDEVLADMRDTVDQHKEIQDVMLNSSSVDVSCNNEDELEEELRELMCEKGIIKPIKCIQNNHDIVADDKNLIAMLDELDVEDGTLSQSSHKTLEFS